MEEKASEPVVKDPEPEVSQTKVPASFGQPPAPLILELIYDDKEKTPAGNIPYKLVFDDASKTTLTGTLNPKGWACIEGCPNAKAKVTFGDSGANDAELDKAYNALESALDETVERFSKHSIESLKEHEHKDITENSKNTLLDYLDELAQNRVGEDQLSLYDHSITRSNELGEKSDNQLANVILSHLPDEKSVLALNADKPIQNALTKAIITGDIDSLEDSLANWGARTDINLKAESKAMEKLILLLNDQKTRSLLASTSQRFISSMSPEQLIELSVCLSDEAEAHVSLNTVSDSISTLTGNISQRISTQVLLSSATDMDCDVYSGTASALANLVNPLKAKRPFNSEYHHKVPIEIPLETASIKASDWAFNNWQEKMSQASGAPDDSILHKIDLADIQVQYGEEAQHLIIMTFEEALEFAENLWIDKDGKDSLGKIKSVMDAIKGSNDSYTLAKGLGGLGVTAAVSTVKGRDYVTISGYKRDLKVLVKGHRWRANNPQAIQYGLGNMNMAKSFLKTGLVVNIIFTIGINLVETIVNDEKTMVDFFGYSALDIIKGIAVTGLAIGAAMTLGSTILVSGVIFAFASLTLGFIIDGLDNEYGVSDKIVQEFKERVLK
ncbi:putative membrane protein [Marinomonas sp. MED121]|uniref:hypothetical protein n=1 Tax=Marinomonas sp. MED121 TaxID=314277 RepID=UPI00006910CD|nr:hypothetical protein [Marinomonas sp. MED121]EAQ67735.1 putative membrane protein [Marinomonas sp. MED121]